MNFKNVVGNTLAQYIPPFIFHVHNGGDSFIHPWHTCAGLSTKDSVTETMQLFLAAGARGVHSLRRMAHPVPDVSHASDECELIAVRFHQLLTPPTIDVCCAYKASDTYAGCFSRPGRWPLLQVGGLLCFPDLVGTYLWLENPLILQPIERRKGVSPGDTRSRQFPRCGKTKGKAALDQPLRLERRGRWACA